MDKYDIIIAEDDPVLRELYLRKFDKKHFNVRTAADGQEALNLIAASPPQVLLLDINMPVKDGIDVLKSLPKEQRSFSVIILTNHEEQIMKDQMNDLGVDGYFVKKDMTLQSLLEMADGLLNKSVAAA
ncbi:MAG: two component transcriptional regulator, winged helix family [Candidatus Peribacteria bacterium]|nr:two component transcriptional regulator, winged helix family [Candidatus Peribacteria bacterium]